MCGDSAGRVEQDIRNRRGSAGNERLMKFIKGCIAPDDCDRSKCPPESYTPLSRADSTQDEQTQYEIFGDVAGFADEIVKKE